VEVVGSMARVKMEVFGSPVFAGLQLVPPSVLLKTPPVPA